MYIKNLLHFIKNTIEYLDYQEHGHWTVTTAIILIASLSAGIQIWGIQTQNKKIWKNKSGEALPLSFFLFQFIYFISYLIYGIKIKSGALIVSNLVFFMFIPVIVGLIKFMPSSRNKFKRELLIMPLLLLIIPCVLLIDAKWSLIVIFIIALLVYWNLLKELKQSLKINNIEPKFIYSVMLSSLVWFIYGIRINNFGIMISSGATVVSAIIILVVVKKIASKPKPRF